MLKRTLLGNTDEYDEPFMIIPLTVLECYGGKGENVLLFNEESQRRSSKKRLFILLSAEICVQYVHFLSLQ